MTALIEPGQIFRGVPFCGDLGALEAEVAVLGAPQGHAPIHGVAAEARVAGGAFVEYVPVKDPSGIGAQAIARLASNVIAAVGGQKSSQRGA